MSIYHGIGLALELGESKIRRQASCPEVTGGSRLVNRKFHCMGSATGEACACSGNAVWQLGNDAETRGRWQRMGPVLQARARPRLRLRGRGRVPIIFVSLACTKVPGVEGGRCSIT